MVECARDRAGLKGYSTNLPASTMPGQAVIDGYHDLYHIDRQHDAIEAHLTVMFRHVGDQPSPSRRDRELDQEDRPHTTAATHSPDNLGRNLVTAAP